ncbi:MAG TPA: hypothetical protein VHP83_01190 [Aggregatilineaceae bacterium]|nr:hypothetical protein [Aggregatilineaceae bacterium]
MSRLFNRPVTFSVILIAALCLGLPGRVQADQARIALELMQDTQATLDDSTPEIIYELTVSQYQFFSVIAWRESGDLNLMFTVTDPDGQPVDTSTLLEDEPGVVVVEGIATKKAGAYGISVARVGQTSGDFKLLAVPGYSGLVAWDQFDGNAGDLALPLENQDTDSFAFGIVDDHYQLQTKAPYTGQVIVSTNDYTDMYLEATITLSNVDDACVGLALRDDGTSGYVVSICGQGVWGIWSMRETEQRSILLPKSLITLEENVPVRLGVRIYGDSIMVYVNGTFVSSAADMQDEHTVGKVGFYLYSAAPATATFDDVVLTVPHTLKAAAAENQSKTSASSDFSTTLAFDLDSPVSYQLTPSSHTARIQQA